MPTLFEKSSAWKPDTKDLLTRPAISPLRQQDLPELRVHEDVDDGVDADGELAEEEREKRGGGLNPVKMHRTDWRHTIEKDNCPYLK